MNYLNYAQLFYYLFGTNDLTFVVAGGIFALVGATISIIDRARVGVKENKQSPYKFSMAYLLKDKWVEYLLGLMATFVAMRFSVELTGANVTMWLSFVYGFLNYRLINVFSKIANTLMNKIKSLTDGGNNKTDQP